MSTEPMEHDDFKNDWQYLPSPEEHARECWEWFRDVIEDHQDGVQGEIVRPSQVAFREP